MASHSELQQHYQQLKTTLLDIGYFHRGTLIKRFIRGPIKRSRFLMRETGVSYCFSDMRL